MILYIGLIVVTLIFMFFFKPVESEEFIQPVPPSEVLLYILLRDNEAFIPTMISQFGEMEDKLDHRFHFLIYENDSTDKTVELIQQWAKNKQNVTFITEKLGQKHTCHGSKCRNPKNTDRCQKLADLRNKVMTKYILPGPSYDYLILMDSDVYFNYKNVKKMFNTLVSNKDIAMVTPYTTEKIIIFKNHYYDISAYIDKDGQQYDVCCYDSCNKCKFLGLWSNYKTPKKYKPRKGLEDVRSAFAGFALLRYAPLKTLNPNVPLWEVLPTHRKCEHTGFCKKILTLGRIVIDHNCILENKYYI